MCTCISLDFQSLGKEWNWILIISETFYWFGDNNYTEWAELFSQYKPPPYKLPKMTGAYSFGVAGIIGKWYSVLGDGCGVIITGPDSGNFLTRGWARSGGFNGCADM